MNAEILRWWNLPPDCSEVEFREMYQEQVFLARKEIRANLYIPKVLSKKLLTYQKWSQSERPHLKFVTAENIEVLDFSHFEKLISTKLLLIERCLDFESLVLVGHQIIAIMEGYRALIMSMTQKWQGEVDQVEVKSAERFPTGAFLLSIKNGQTIEDWKIPLLKERRRLQFVF